MADGHGTPTSRRGFLGWAAAGGTSLAFAAKAPAVHAEVAPFRVGILNTYTGVNAVAAEANLKGVNFYFERINWTVAGRKIEIIKEDDQFSPQVGLQKARKLVESDKVDIICGPQASNVALAVMNYCRGTKTVTLVWAGADAITWERIPFLFRPGLSSWQLSTPMADWVAANVSKDVVLAAADFAAGRDVMRTFKAAFAPKGGKVLKEIYPPLGTTDYSAYLTDILSIGAPAVFAFFTGTDATRFVQQFSEFGVNRRTRLTGFTALVDGSTINAQGDSALGVVTSQIYSDTLSTPENRAFVKDFRARYGEFPDTYSEYGFVTSYIIENALKKTNGDILGKEALVQAIGETSFNAPRGPFRFDPVTHNPIQNVYVTEVSKVDGRYIQQVISTIENVRDPGQKPT